MRWLKYTAYVLGILLLVALVLPWLIPISSYIPTLEKLASEKLQKPVKIAALDFGLLPTPAVKLHGLQIGDKDKIEIQGIAVKPALTSLWREVKVLRAVEVSGVKVDEKLLAFANAMNKPGKKEEPQAVRVEHIRLRNLQLDMKDLKWGPLRADIDLNETGVEGIDAGSEDGKFKLELTPGKEAQDLQIDAKQWPLPFKPALLFEQLAAQGKLQKTALNLPTLDGKLYGGQLKGGANLDWSQGWRMKADVSAQGVETKDIVTQLTKSVAVSGKLYAQANITSQAKEAGQLGDHLRGTVKFEVKQGVLYGYDLAQAVKSLARGGTRGGQTRFDVLTGNIIITGKQYQLRDLNVVSGVLSAKGDVTIAPSKKLSGTVKVAMKGSLALVEVPLDVSGTVSDPVLLPNAAALAGAATGTVLMGPVGTGLGSKAGQALGNIFK